MAAKIEAFYDPATGTVSYVVYDRVGGEAAVIDSVLDFDPKSGRTSSTSAQRIVQFVRQQRLHVTWLLETHAHADHLSAAAYLRRELGGRIGIGARIQEVQRTFGELFDFEQEFVPDGRQFDHQFADGERFHIGELPVEVMYVPGHTPADVAYRVAGDDAFVGDTLFMPDVGTARCDFPGGNAEQLYASLHTLLALPSDTRLHVCHDYPPATRQGQPKWTSTVAEQRAYNIHVGVGRSAQEFVRMRTERDAKLPMPALMLPSVQVNVRAGELPPAQANGRRYLKIPVDVM